MVEVPLTHRPRRHGTSKYGVSNRLWRGIRDLFGVLWLKSRLIDYRIRDLQSPVPDAHDGARQANRS